MFREKKTVNLFTIAGTLYFGLCLGCKVISLGIMFRLGLNLKYLVE